MVYFYFVLGFVLYCLSTEYSYSDKYKKLEYYALYGSIFGIITNYVWFSIVKMAENNEHLLKLGFYWDAMIVFCFLLIPMLFHGLRPQSNTILGIIFIIFGIILTKVKI